MPATRGAINYTGQIPYKRNAREYGIYSRNSRDFEVAILLLIGLH